MRSAPQNRLNTSAIPLTTVGNSLGHSHDQPISTVQSIKYRLNDAHEPPLRIAFLVLPCWDEDTTSQCGLSNRFCRGASHSLKI